MVAIAVLVITFHTFLAKSIVKLAVAIVVPVTTFHTMVKNRKFNIDLHSLVEFINKIPKRRLLKYVKENCRIQAAVLLEKEEIAPDYTFTSEDIKIIEKMPLEEWRHWRWQIEMAEGIAAEHPTVFFEYIREYFPQVSRRKTGKRKGIESLLPEELSMIITEPDETWKKRIEIKQKAYSIKQSYREGYETYCEITGNDSPKPAEIFSNHNKIADLQKAYEQSLIYKDWGKRQNDFDNKYYDICKTCRANDGRVTYQVEFTHYDKYDKRVCSKFKILQGFVESYSYAYENLQSPQMKACRKNLPEFLKKERHFKDSVYDGIYNIIDSVSNMQESKPLVVFVCSSIHECSKGTYDYHYKYLRKKLVTDGYETINMESITDIRKDNEYESVIIIDFITNNNDMKNNCQLIAEYFTKKQPCIAYYSLLKKCTKEEMKIFNRNSTAKDEQNGIVKHTPPPSPKDNATIEFIKSQFQRVNKHPFFSYIAITNTLIGKAAHAEKVKEQWLDNPSAYQVEIVTTATQIGAHYSTDGGNSHTVFYVKADASSLDDVVEFTYRLFKSMGVLSLFAEKGSKAIDYMNRYGFLSTHQISML